MFTTIIAILPLTSPTTSIGSFSFGLHLKLGITLGNSKTDFLKSNLFPYFTDFCWSTKKKFEKINQNKIITYFQLYLQIVPVMQVAANFYHRLNRFQPLFLIDHELQRCLIVIVRHKQLLSWLGLDYVLQLLHSENQESL